jgi:hypothetical protein
MVKNKKGEKSMESKKTIEKYVKPSPILNIIAIVLVVAALFMVVAGIVSAGNAKDAAGEPELFHPFDSPVDSYAYIDVVSISNWLYKIDGAVYYVVTDAEGYNYTARVPDSAFNKMDAQYDYYMSEDPNAKAPAPYRLAGTALIANKDLKDTISECVGIKASEYEDYFGELYLNAALTPGDDALSGWLVGALMCGIFGVIFFVCTIPASITFNNCVKALEEANLLDRAAAELESGEFEKIGNDCGRLSRSFLYCKNTGFVAPYSDIQWVYRRNVKQYFLITVNVNLIVSTLKMDQRIALNFSGKNRDEEFNKIFMTIAQNNPDVLIGFTGENQRAYKNRVKAAKVG